MARTLGLGRAGLLVGLALAGGCDSNMDIGPARNMPNPKLTYISATKEFTVRLHQAAGLLGVMNDTQTTKKRQGDLEGVTRRLQELQTELKVLGPAPSSAEVDKLLVEQGKARERFTTQLRRVNGIPEVVSLLGGTLVALNQLEK
jgi:hypothetical protein